MLLCLRGALGSGAGRRGTRAPSPRESCWLAASGPMVQRFVALESAPPPPPPKFLQSSCSYAVSAEQLLRKNLGGVGGGVGQALPCLSPPAENCEHHGLQAMDSWPCPMHIWPRGPMDKASAHGAGNCRFESCRGHSLAQANQPGNPCARRQCLGPRGDWGSCHKKCGDTGV